MGNVVLLYPNGILHGVSATLNAQYQCVLFVPVAHGQFYSCRSLLLVYQHRVSTAGCNSDNVVKRNFASLCIEIAGVGYAVVKCAVGNFFTSSWSLL